MKTPQLSLLLFLLIVTSSSSPFKPNYASYASQLTPTSPQSLPSAPHTARQLLTRTQNPIRITLDASSFNTIVAGPSGTTTVANLAFISKTMQVAANFFMNRIKVYPLTGLTAPGTCTADYTPSTNDQNYGIGNSDLHIYLLYKTDSSLSYGATGASCKYYSPGGTLPDTTLQLGRPVMGRIIFNTYNLVDQLTSLTNLVFQSVTATAIHETMHILGFDSTRFSTWLVPDQNDPRFGNTYTSTTISGSGTISASRPSTTLLTTPHVLSWARSFFNCPTLPGMPLQNQDGTGLGAGSHWQRVAMYDQIMTGTSLGTTPKYFSGLSFAVLKDMGWYTVDDTFAGGSNYGYHKGCSFVYDACYSGSFTQFCNAGATSGISSCQTSYFGKAICTNQIAAMADGCGIYGPYTNCIDPSTTDNSYASYTRQTYSTSSFCIASTLGTVALPSSLTSRCYPYVCGTSSITFTIGTYTIICGSGQTGVEKTLSAMTGSLTCPDFASFCTNARKTCASWCSKNGFCMGGICNCLPGYYGNDCSKTTCTTNQYYNSLTSTCVTTCPSGYYQNIYSRSCLACSPSCQQCYNHPDTCTGCISTTNNPQYFHNGTCYSVCPAGTYTSGYNCSICDSSVFCATCSGTATNCTSCLYDIVNGQDKYLEQPGSGNCINQCPVSGTFTIADVVNMVCVATCDNNLVLINNTCTYCQGNTYKFVDNSSCISSCPDYYYPDPLKHLCTPCDSSCLTCAGPYAQNCTSCSSTATLRYWLLNMCWSVCPGGYYANDTANTCQICPTNINCGNCTYNNGSNTVTCTSCAYGYYMQTNTNVCTANCNSNQYPLKSNNTCITCHSACLTCSGPSNSSCTSCTPPLLFLQNLTGGFCVSTCNPIGYTSSGLTNCLPCDRSCLTCLGTSNNQCTSCDNTTFLSDGYCRLVCPAGKYANKTSRFCDGCDGSCSYCFGGTIDNCTGCINGMVLYNFTCRIGCPKGYTVNQWNVCHQGYMVYMGVVAMLVMIMLM